MVPFFKPVINEEYIQIKDISKSHGRVIFSAHYRVPGQGGIGVYGNTAEDARSKLINKLKETDKDIFVESKNPMLGSFRLMDQYPQPDFSTEG